MRARKKAARRSRITAWVLVVAVAGLGAAVWLERGALRQAVLRGEEPEAESSGLVQFDRFSAHLERSPEGERLGISLRLRTNNESLPCYTFVVARNDHVVPRVWAIWPQQAPGPAMTSGGHFHGSRPDAGYPITLSDSWQRVNATLPVPQKETFDTVIVYVLAADGKVLLSRPFRI
jgi:hypothetical protein